MKQKVISVKVISKLTANVSATAARWRFAKD
jgi:hypothetical protein